MFAQTAESYVVLDNAAGTLTFKHDANKPAGAFSLNEGELYPAWYAMAGDHTGYNENNIKKVVFDSSFANARPTNCCFWFVGCKDLTVIEGLEYLNTEKVTSMRSMFASCTNLTSLDVSKFRTQNVTDMYYMFGDCSSLTSLDVSKFDTRNVTDMDFMFNNCSNLTSLDVSKFDTQSVTNMDFMFFQCYSLTFLDLSNFDTQNVTNMYGMFYGCVNLATIYASDKFVTTACSEDCEIFGNCKKLVGAVPYDPNRIGKEMANYTTGYFTYKAASGIDAVSATDNIAAEYYDVNGRRLNAPQKGINIVKRGNITTKVLVK
jgi:surface protein